MAAPALRPGLELPRGPTLRDAAPFSYRGGVVIMHTAELELQANWFSGRFGELFLTTEGVPVRVVSFGQWNHEAGPDFIHAAVTFDGGPVLTGAIELDWDARDWEHHGHSSNSDYQQVILHVFFQSAAATFFTRTASGSHVPQVRLDLNTIGAPRAVRPAALSHCSGKDLAELVEAAAKLRVQTKAVFMARTAAHHGRDEALYQALAGALGYKSNKLPFTTLAQRLPVRQLLTEPASAEAMLLGVAGFLSANDLSAFDAQTRGYLRELWEHWWPKRAGYERLILSQKQWRTSGSRPANHPQRRLGALAVILRHWPKLRALARDCEVDAIEEFFGSLSHDYWNRHYSINSARTAESVALIGRVRVADMLANVFFPYAIWHKPDLWKRYLKLKPPLGNRLVESASMRIFGTIPPELSNSVFWQQGILELHRRFSVAEEGWFGECRPMPVI